MGKKEKGMEIIMRESVVKNTDSALEKKIMADRENALCAVVHEMHEVMQNLPYYHYVCQDDGIYLTLFSLKRHRKRKGQSINTQQAIL
jgi:hypothetical protein